MLKASEAYRHTGNASIQACHRFSDASGHRGAGLGLGQLGFEPQLAAGSPKLSHDSDWRACVVVKQKRERKNIGFRPFSKDGVSDAIAIAIVGDAAQPTLPLQQLDRRGQLDVIGRSIKELLGPIHLSFPPLR
jgi:hypothetical protein